MPPRPCIGVTPRSGISLAVRYPDVFDPVPVDELAHRPQLHVLYPLVDRPEVPGRQDRQQWQLGHDDLGELRVERLALALVERSHSLVEDGVDLGVLVAHAVEATRL